MNKEGDCIFNFYGQSRRKVGEKKFSCSFSSLPYLGDNKEIRVRKIDTFE